MFILPDRMFDPLGPRQPGLSLRGPPCAHLQRLPLCIRISAGPSDLLDALGWEVGGGQPMKRRALEGIQSSMGSGLIHILMAQADWGLHTSLGGDCVLIHKTGQ